MTQFKTHITAPEANERNKAIRNYRETPDWLFDALHEVFHFTIDAAANADNNKLDNYFSEEDNALERPWAGEIVFCNPPTSDGEYGIWLEKAALEYLNSGVTTAMVVPLKWETKGFKEVRDTARYLILPDTRVKFDPPEGLEGKSPTFYSCIAVFTWFTFSVNDLELLSQIGSVIDLDKGIVKGREQQEDEHKLKQS